MNPGGDGRPIIARGRTRQSGSAKRAHLASLSLPNHEVPRYIAGKSKKYVLEEVGGTETGVGTVVPRYLN